MRSTLKVILVSLLTTLYTYADFIGGEVSLGAFNHAPKGYASYDLYGSGGEISVKDDLYWDNAQNLVVKGYLEHPLLFIPNIKLGYASLSNEGSGPVTTFGWGEIADFNGIIGNKMELRLTDVTLYYELLDNWVSIDTGLTLRHIEGDITVSANTSPVIQKERVDFDTWIPMIYLKGRFDFPVTDLSIQAEANAISYADTILYDAELSIRYTVLIGLGIEGGYKTMHIENDELASHLNIDLDFSGPYAAVVWDF